MSPGHLLETLLVRALAAGIQALPWRASLVLGATLGDAARVLGLRRVVAEQNLARAFPEKSTGERSRILV